MVGEVKIDISGAREIEQVLKQLPPRVAKQVVERSLRAGARVIVKEARAKVRRRTGMLAKSIAVAKTKRGDRGGAGRIFIGFRPPHSRRAHLTEYGTRHSRAFPFMRPAIDTKGAEAIDKIGQTLGQGVERVATELAGKFRDIRKTVRRVL